jgi:predicted nucleic acid-binding protein
VKVSDALRGVTRLFLDTAPVIYYVEENPAYLDVVTAIFDSIDDGAVVGITSPVTLAECLVMPYRLGLVKAQQDFVELIVLGTNVDFVAIDHATAVEAARLRAAYNLTLPDALQVATAISAGCEAFLTNDTALQRVAELRVIVVSQLEP